jgi:hypothetical protein
MRPAVSRICRTPMPRSHARIFDLKSARAALTSAIAGACTVTTTHHLKWQIGRGDVSRRKPCKAT